MKFLVFATLMFLAPLSFAKSSQAVYEVPGAQDKELRFYEMSKINLNVHGDRVVLKYSLPLDLTGEKNDIVAEGVFTEENKATLQGPKSNMVCDFIAKRCDVRYNDLSVDLALVKERLESQSVPADKLEQRLAISRRFSGDPIGVIYFTRF